MANENRPGQRDAGVGEPPADVPAAPPVTGHVEHFHIGSVQQFPADADAPVMGPLRLRTPESRPPFGTDDEGNPRQAPWAADSSDDDDEPRRRAARPTEHRAQGDQPPRPTSPPTPKTD